jgi:hypothetical protein
MVAKAADTLLDLMKLPLPVRRKPIRRKVLPMPKPWQVALKPGKRPATA